MLGLFILGEMTMSNAFFVLELLEGGKKVILLWMNTKNCFPNVPLFKVRNVLTFL